MRLFAAIRPPEQVRTHLARAVAAVGATVDGEVDPSRPLRWAPPDRWHLTLAFYGEVPDGATDELDGALAGVAVGRPPFHLRLRGAGVFAGRTLWMGAAGDVDAVAALSSAARRAGDGVVAREDDRVRSRPHLTVARVSSRQRARSARRRAPVGLDGGPADTVAGLVRALAVYEGPTWTVRSFDLVRSEPGRGQGGGPLYTTASTYLLNG